MSGDQPGGSFPRRFARTQRFTLGAPRSFTPAAGGRVLFVRSAAGDDPIQRLWVLDLADGRERCIASPEEFDAGFPDLPPEERARRERARESAGGIVAYAVDRAATVAAFALGGRLLITDLASGESRPLETGGAVVDPRPDPTGRRVAYVQGGRLAVVELDSGTTRTLVAEDAPGVTWGLPEFVAAEEMGRTRGFWWAPDGERLAVARVDTSPVTRWHVTDPADPAQTPVSFAYPAAGSANARVTLAVVGLDGRRLPVRWDAAGFEYLADVVWGDAGPLTLVVQSRDQRSVRVLTVDPEGVQAGAETAGESAVDTAAEATGAGVWATVVAEQHDEHWVDLVPGVPRWLPSPPPTRPGASGGRLVWSRDDADTRRITVDGVAVTPVGLQVRRVLDAAEDGIVFTASGADPTVVALWRVRPGGDGLERLSPEDRVTDGAAAHGVVVMQSGRLGEPATRTVVCGLGIERTVVSLAETPTLRPCPQLARLGRRELCSALLLPSGHSGDGPLPVLLDPYGGPHTQRVLRRLDGYLAPQWFADQGFAVLVSDGRGTPGRGPRWERALAGDLATAPLQDQVDALEAAAERHPQLDLSRVAIRGWSFGGYLAALAVLRRPDVFAAAIAGAPVTDWRLYDTHYTERYLGSPAANPVGYDASSLLADAARLDRPLLLIHGLADDNVVVAHTLRLSRALLEAGRPHTVLPLSGVTHITPQEAVAENLLHLQLAFLRQSLGITAAFSAPAPTPQAR